MLELNIMRLALKDTVGVCVTHAVLVTAVKLLTAALNALNKREI